VRLSDGANWALLVLYVLGFKAAHSASQARSCACTRTQHGATVLAGGQSVALLIIVKQGGRWAMRFACENPTFVEKLIIVDMTPVIYPLSSYDGIRDILRMMASIDLHSLKSRKEADTQASTVIKVRTT
jgi:hypothetical protein